MNWADSSKHPPRELTCFTHTLPSAETSNSFKLCARSAPSSLFPRSEIPTLVISDLALISRLLWSLMIRQVNNWTPQLNVDYLWKHKFRLIVYCKDRFTWTSRRLHPAEFVSQMKRSPNSFFSSFFFKLRSSFGHYLLEWRAGCWDWIYGMNGGVYPSFVTWCSLHYHGAIVSSKWHAFF